MQRLDAAAVLPARTPQAHAGAAAALTRPWPDLALVLVAALLLRLAFFNGVFGSDDAVYLERALQVASGDWSSSDYNGALRYGYNIPAGICIALFGPSIAAANLWPLLCSLAEIALAWTFALAVWGRRAALFAALLLAALPLHAAVATRIHADPVVSCFLSAAFVLFFFACTRRSRGLCFAAGLAMGAVFWTKELAAVTLFAFFAFPLVWRRIDARWIWVVAGFALMLAAHFALMTAIAGDPLHLIRVVTGALGRTFIGAGEGEDAPLYYVRYLLVAIQHTGLAGWIAAATLVAWLLARRRGVVLPAGAGYAAIWLLALLAVLSVWPVSLSPLRFTMKQSNYLTLFLAPLAIVAGAGLARLPARAGVALLVVTLVVGTALMALEQADYRVFTANGRAAHAFAQSHPDATVAGTASNAAVSAVLDRVAAPGAVRNPVQRYDAIDAASPRPLYVVVDPASSGWFAGARRVDAALPCWRRVQALAPAGLGAGPALVGAVTESTPAPIGMRLARFAKPTIAVVYAADRADPWCGASR